MAKQTFTVGQVLTADQMTSLQQTAMGGGSATAKTASYVLLAADAGSTVIMNSASSTTITVNTSLFAAGDTVLIVNQGAGVCTVTAGTATVSTAGSLALAQYETGILYFLSTGAAIFSDYTQTAAAGGKVLQVVNATYSTSTSTSSGTMADTGLTATITPTLNTSKVLVLVNQNGLSKTGNLAGAIRLLRGATSLFVIDSFIAYTNTATVNSVGGVSVSYQDAPATTSATTYKTQFLSDNGASFTVQAQAGAGATTSTITLLEIGA
jgi:hypothetical protein